MGSGSATNKVHTRANPKTAAETKENVTLKASFLTQLI